MWFLILFSNIKRGLARIITKSSEILEIGVLLIIL